MADLDRMQLLQQEEGDIQNRIACLRRRLDINGKMQAELLDAVPLQPAVVPVTRPKAFVPPARPPPVQPKPEVPAKIKPEIITKAAIVKNPPQLRPPPLEVKQKEIVKQEPEEPRPSKSLPHLGGDVEGGADVRLRDAARLSSPQSPARVARIVHCRRRSGEPVALRVLRPEEASPPRPSKTSKRLSPRPSSPPPVEKARPRQPHPPRGPPPAELVQAAKTMSTTSKSSGLGQPRPSSTPTGATTMAPGTSEEEDVDKWIDEDTSW